MHNYNRNALSSSYKFPFPEIRLSSLFKLLISSAFDTVVIISEGVHYSTPALLLILFTILQITLLYDPRIALHLPLRPMSDQRACNCSHRRYPERRLLFFAGHFLRFRSREFFRVDNRVGMCRYRSTLL